MIKINKQSRAQFGTWVSGSLRDGFGMRFDFTAKVFEGPSPYGIPTPRFEDGGNVSKLHLKGADGRELYCWERGPGYIDCDEDAAWDAVHEIVSCLEDAFCK